LFDDETTIKSLFLIKFEFGALWQGVHGCDTRNVSQQMPDLRYGNGYHIIARPTEIEYITAIWYVKKWLAGSTWPAFKLKDSVHDVGSESALLLDSRWRQETFNSRT
jgi:hypothetical protein